MNFAPPKLGGSSQPIPSSIFIQINRNCFSFSLRFIDCNAHTYGQQFLYGGINKKQNALVITGNVRKTTRHYVGRHSTARVRTYTHLKQKIFLKKTLCHTIILRRKTPRHPSIELIGIKELFFLFYSTPLIASTISIYNHRQRFLSKN